MTTGQRGEYLESELAEVGRLAARSADHWLMGPGLRAREAEIKEELSGLLPSDLAPKASVYFEGDPVSGSHGISVKFAAKALQFFQVAVSEICDDILASQSEISKRGQKGNDKLLITGTLPGSFGFTIEAAQSNSLFEENAIAESLRDITKVIEAAGNSEENLMASIDTFSEPAKSKVHDFLSFVEKSKAGLRIEAGATEAYLPAGSVKSAMFLIQGLNFVDKDFVVEGIQRGITAESRRFDLRSESGELISGKISPIVTAEQLEQWIELFNQNVTASLHHRVTRGSSTADRNSWTLRDMELLQ